MQETRLREVVSWETLWWSRCENKEEGSSVKLEDRECSCKSRLIIEIMYSLVGAPQLRLRRDLSLFNSSTYLRYLCQTTWYNKNRFLSTHLKSSLLLYLGVQNPLKFYLNLLIRTIKTSGYKFYLPWLTTCSFSEVILHSAFHTFNSRSAIHHTD